MKPIISNEAEIEVAMRDAIPGWNGPRNLSDADAEQAAIEWATAYIIEHYTFTARMQAELALVGRQEMPN
jgi:hypothetical protein